MADLITITDVVTEFGAYYQKGSANFKNLTKQLFQDLVTPGVCTPIITDDTIYRVSAAEIAEILQPYQDLFTKKGDLTFTPKEIPLRQIKIDWEENPSKFQPSWLGFLANNNTDRLTWPFVKWLMEEKIIKRSKQDRELLIYFKGVYVAATPGTPGSAGSVMDGIKKLIDEGITDASMYEVNLADLTNSNIFDQVELFSDALPDTWIGHEVNICMSPSWVKKYNRDKRNTHGVDPSYKKGDLTVDFSEHNIVGLPSMAGTDYIFATPKFNLVHPQRRNAGNDFQLEGSKRTVSIYTDWWEGIGFLDNDLVYANAPGWSAS
jgi:hypothetical protein